MLKTTCLIDKHRSLGARLVDFGGWEMPVQYQGIPVEHHAVRKAAGLFDISHMGEFEVQGPDAAAFLNQVLTHDITKLEPGSGQYSLLCQDQGGVIDDLYIYQTGPSAYLMVINASRVEADFEWLNYLWKKRFAGLDLSLENQSTHLSAIALQGPHSRSILSGLALTPLGLFTDVQVDKLSKNRIEKFKFEGEEVWISCTGYTGEDGFEMIGSDVGICKLWDALLATGDGNAVQPAGLGARDTLRTEACYPLYGHELSESTSPLEAGLGFAVALNKGPFVGKETLVIQKTAGLSRKLMAFTMEGKTPPPRNGYPIRFEGGFVGITTSGTQSPTLGLGIGMGYIPAELALIGNRIEIEIRNKTYPALIRKKPLYRKPV